MLDAVDAQRAHVVLREPRGLRRPGQGADHELRRSPRRLAQQADVEAG